MHLFSWMQPDINAIEEQEEEEGNVMSVKAVKLVAVAVPTVWGFASIRVYAMSEAKTEGLLSPHELSIYTPLPRQLHFVAEQPGVLESSLTAARGILLPYVQAVKDAFLSVNVGAINVYNAGEDAFHFLKDPPPGFLTRVSMITVSGLAGVILARKGSRLKRLGLPLGLAAAATAVCYPAPTVGLLKVTGKRLYAASQWTGTTVGSLWKAIPTKESTALPPASPESAAPPKPEVPPGQVIPGASEQSSAVPPPQGPAPPPEPEARSVPAHARHSGTEHAALPAGSQPLVMSMPKQFASLLQTPATQSRAETPASQASADVKTPTEKPGFVADPKLMDFGQSDPEDTDLYSTRQG